jgi:hypothetical protein
MTDAITNLRASLEKAVNMIEESELLPIENQIDSGDLHSRKAKIDFSQANSLLEKCDNIEQQYYKTKPVLRIIHHFACSGGTLVSKCLSAMPNIFLLSEVHPHSDLQRNKEKLQYSPSDVARLAIYAEVPSQKQLAEKIFVESIKTAHQHIQEFGGTLVLREHSHSDYCVGDTIHNNTVAELLSEYFEINSIVTLRNPIDSYLSLLANDWVHFKPATFDEYCSRLIAFLKPFTKEQIILYEDFVQKPHQVVEQLCSTLDVSFSDSFEAIYDTFVVTGDSGRKGSEINLRARRACSDEFLEEVKASKCFKILSKQFGYK